MTILEIIEKLNSLPNDEKSKEVLLLTYNTFEDELRVVLDDLDRLEFTKIAG